MSRAPLDGYVGSDADAMRMRRIATQRQKEHEQFEARKRVLDEDDGLATLDVGSRFEYQKTSKAEEQLAQETVGLQSISEFKKKKIFLEQGDQAAQYLQQKRIEEEQKKKGVEQPKRAEPKAPTKKLSFLDEGEDMEPAPVKKISKDPTVDTTFLPDKERDEKKLKEYEERRQREIAEEEMQLNQLIEVPYSFYDGIDHRRTLFIKRGAYIADFLDMVRKQITELKGNSIDNIVFVKEEYMIPQHYTFHQLMNSGHLHKGVPLFDWHVTPREKLALHPVWVTDRTWYVQNKTTWPANQWKVYDPEQFVSRVETDPFIKIFKSISQGAKK